MGSRLPQREAPVRRSVLVLALAVCGCPSSDAPSDPAPDGVTEASSSSTEATPVDAVRPFASDLDLRVYRRDGGFELIGRTGPGVRLEVPAEGGWYVEPVGNLDAASAQALADVLRDQRVPGLALSDPNYRPIELSAEVLQAFVDVPTLRFLRLLNTHMDGETWDAVGRLTQLHSLVFDGGRFSGDELRRITSLTELRELDVPPFVDLEGPDLELLANFPQLETLSLRRSQALGAGLEHLSALTQLRTLDLSMGTGIRPDALRVLRELPRLESLNLSFCAVDDRAFAHLGHVSTLKTLDLSGSSVTDAGFAQLRGLDLEAVYALSCEALGDPSAEVLASFERLEVLALTQSRLTDAGLQHLLGLQHLRELILFRNRGLTGADVDFGALPQLETLSVASTRFDDDALSGLTRTSVRELSLSGTRVTDQGLNQLRGLKQLERLSLSGCSVTDQGLAQLGDVPLRFLELRSSPLTGSGLSGLHADTLETLILDSSEALTAEGLAGSLPTLTHLETLSLNRSSGVDARVLAAIGRIEGLESLSLSFSRGTVDDEGLGHLSNLERLKHLDLSGAAGLTNAGLRQLKGLSLETLTLTGAWENLDRAVYDEVLATQNPR